MKTNQSNTKPAEGAQSADNRQCFDLTNDEIETGGSELASLCSDAGHSHLRSFLNEGRLWSSTVEEVAAMLRQDCQR